MITIRTVIERYAPQDGYVCDAKDFEQAHNEKQEYRMISPGYYLCCTSDRVYLISEYKGEIGCSCEEMSNMTGKQVCKHLIGFLELDEPPFKPAGPIYEEILKAQGWTGAKLHPPGYGHRNGAAQNKGTPAPPLHDPERKPKPQAAQRATRKRSYDGMTPEEIIRETPLQKVQKYAKSGSQLAKDELKRREAEAEKEA